MLPWRQCGQDKVHGIFSVFYYRDPRLYDKKGYSSMSDDTPKKNREVLSLYPAIFRAFGPYYFITGLYKLVFDLIGFINPQLVR